MKFPFEITVSTEEETANVAKEFARILKKGDVVKMEGNLGAGKTFFVKSVLSFFKNYEANSPTFAIVNEYFAEGIKFYHFDFYRINKEYELYDIGIEDYLTDENAITFVEWADLFPEVIFNAKYKIEISYTYEGKRKINISKI